MVRGIRGAITIEADQSELVLEASKLLLVTILQYNPALVLDDIASVFFSATADIQSVYPARAARELGWTNTPLFCTQEMNVRNSLPLCIRVLIHWNTDQPQPDIKHVFLGKASSLRPDLVKP